MKKMMLLASVVALAALMLAAAPAFAQDIAADGDKVEVCHFPGGNPANAHIIDISVNALPAHLAEHERDFVVDGLECPPDGDDVDGDDDGRDDDDNGDDGRDGRDVFRDIGNVEVAPVFDITQDIEQECDSEEVNQSIDVTGGGANSNQTVGLQPTANTGCAQNATGILDVDPFVAGFGGDNVFVNDNGDDNGDENGDDGRFIRCDLDGDGNDDGVECEDFDDGLVFCDRDGDGKDDGDDDCFVFVNDDDDNGDNGDNGDVIIRDRGDDINIHGAQGDEFEVDSNASIDVSPVQTVTSDNQVNQAAAASAPQWVLTWHGWVLV